MSQNEIDNETQEKLDAFIKQEEGDSNDYKGLLAKFITLVAVGMSLFHLYAAYSIVPTQQLRVIHVGLVLFLVFLSFPIAARFKNRLMLWDVLFAIGSVAILITSSVVAMISLIAILHLTQRMSWWV